MSTTLLHSFTNPEPQLGLRSHSTLSCMPENACFIIFPYRFGTRAISPTYYFSSIGLTNGMYTISSLYDIHE